MVRWAGEGAAGAAEFELQGWRVQPSLNRLTRGGATVRLEPKLMDVLAHLARHAGQVVSKDELAAAVWPDVFVSESVITRAIAGLRRALGDDARQPRYIETIAKRGYRLIAPPTPVAAAPVGAPSAAVAAAPAFHAGRDGPAAGAAPPYVVGQWVRGEAFYGRGAEIAQVLDGPRNGLWLLGARAVGKTSALKQLEHLTAAGEERGFFPLFWDLQGSECPEDLDADFAEVLADAEPRLAAVDLRPTEVAAGDFLTALGRLRRALVARGLTLLLLLDEAEALVPLQAASPALLRKLRRALQSAEGVRTVLASSSRLWRLAEQRDDTSPFLHGFAPPLYLGCLEDEAARRLVRQAQAPAAFGIADGDDVVDEILRRSGNHPYLLQLLCSRYWQLGDLDRAGEAVGADPAVRHFFAVDHDLLSPLEREVLGAIAAGGDDCGVAASPGEVAAARLHLERLGVVGRGAGSRLEVRSPILARWLAERADQKL